MDYSKQAKELKNNTQVITSTFETSNLRVVDVSYHKGVSFLAYVELVTIEGANIPYDVIVKINYYDHSGELYSSYSSDVVRADKFLGYDTITLYTLDDDYVLDHVAKARIYLVRR